MSWREKFVAALAAKDPVALEKIFTDNPRLTAHVALSTAERVRIAEAWVSQETANTSAPLPDKKRHARIAKLIEQLPDSLYAACRSRDPNLARVLFSHAKPSQFTIIDEFNRSPLFYAATLDDHKVAHQITAMMVARFTSDDDKETLLSLVNQVDAPQAEMGTTGAVLKPAGKSVLHRVSYIGNRDVMRLLLQEGAEVYSDELLSSPYALLCNNNDRRKTDAQIVAGLTLFTEHRYDFSGLDKNGQSALHIACEQYAHGQVGSSVIFYLLKHGAFDLLHVADKNDLKPPHYFTDDSKQVFFTDMSTNEPQLYFEYLLSSDNTPANQQFLDNYVKGMNAQPQLFQQLCSAILKVELYSTKKRKHSQVLLNLLNVLHSNCCRQFSLSDELKHAIIFAYMGAEPRALIPRKHLSAYQTALADSARYATLLAEPTTYSQDELSVLQSHQRTATASIDAALHKADKVKYQRVAILLLTLPYDANADVWIRQTLAFLGLNSRAPRSDSAEELFSENQVACCKILFGCFQQLVATRHGIPYQSAMSYVGIAPERAQKIVTEISSIRERNSFFRQFCPGFAYYFAKSYHETFTTDDPEVLLEKYKVVYDALVEAGQFPGAEELLKHYVTLIDQCPLAEERVKRSAKLALSTAPKAVIFRESVSTSIASAWQAQTGAHAATTLATSSDGINATAARFAKVGSS